MSYQQPLFEYMLNEHGLMLLQSEMHEIEDIVKKMYEPKQFENK